jgi:DNA-binding transcriptional MerR regulator
MNAAKKTKFHTYTISELSKEFDVTPRAIRFYEDQGLISPSRKGSRRIYKERDRIRLKLILRGKRLGFSLAEVKESFQLYDSDLGEVGQLSFLLEKIAQRRAILEQQQKDIKIVLAEMNDVEARAKKALGKLSK